MTAKRVSPATCSYDAKKVKFRKPICSCYQGIIVVPYNNIIYLLTMEKRRNTLSNYVQLSNRRHQLRE